MFCSRQVGLLVYTGVSSPYMSDLQSYSELILLVLDIFVRSGFMFPPYDRVLFIVSFLVIVLFRVELNALRFFKPVQTNSPLY